MNERSGFVNTHTLLPYGLVLDEHHTVMLHRPERFGALSRFALGCVWDVRPLDIDLLDEDEIEGAADDVKSLLLLLEPGATFDVRLDMRPITHIPEWEAYYANRSDDAITRMREHIRNGMAHRPGADPLHLTECKVVISYRFPISPNKSLVRDLIDTLTQIKPWGHTQAEAALTNRLHAAFDEHRRAFESDVEGIERSLRLLNLSPNRLGGSALVAALNRAASPNPTDDWLYKPGVPLGEHVHLPGFLGDRSVETETHHATVYTLERSIAECFAGMLGGTRTPEAKLHGLRLAELDAPISIVVTVMVQDQGKKRAALSLRHALSNLHVRGGLGEERPEAAKQTDALAQLVRDMADESEQVHDTMVSAIVWNRHDATPVDAVFKKMSLDMGIQWYREPFIAGTLFLRSLPLGCDPGFPTEKLVRRSRQMVTRTIARLAPLWGSFRGGTTPTAIYVNCRGEPVFFDLFDHTPGPHVTIVGKIRRGKSAFLNTVIDQVGDTYMVFVLDRYGSYDTLAEFRNGTLIKFSRANPICIGPMMGDLDSNHQQHMAMIIEEMVMAGFRDSHVTPDERTLIGNFVGDWALKGPREQTMSDFCRYLDGLNDPFSERLSLLLGPYHGNGRYAPFVDGPNQLHIGERPLWVADIAGLEDFPELQSVMTASLFTSLERYISNWDRLETRKILAADEVSFLLRNPQAAEFLRKLAVALARFRCSFCLISQNMSDFLTDLGSTVVKMADTHVFFNIGRAELHDISEVFKLSEHTIDTIAHLRRFEDCSECVIRYEEGEGGAGVIRVVPPPDFITAIGQSETHRRARGEI